MNFKNYTPEMKTVLVASLEGKIAECERIIADAKIMISDIKGVDIIIENKKTIVKSELGARKPKDGGWFDKIKTVLQKSTEPLTSRDILDKISLEFSDVPNNSTSMGSLSPALKAAANEGLLIRVKLDGQFAKFELSDKNIIDFQNAVNQ